MATPRQLPEGSSADIVTHCFNGFPTATSAEFRDLLLAIGSSGAGATKPTALDTFLAAHPIAKTFITTQKPFLERYATLSYFGVNTFEFAGANGRQHFVRYRFVPFDGEAFLSNEQVVAAGPRASRRSTCQKALPVPTQCSIWQGPYPLSLNHRQCAAVSQLAGSKHAN